MTKPRNQAEVPQDANANSSIIFQNVTTEPPSVNSNCSSRGRENRKPPIVMVNVNQSSSSQGEAAVNISGMFSTTDSNKCSSNKRPRQIMVKYSAGRDFMFTVPWNSGAYYSSSNNNSQLRISYKENVIPLNISRYNNRSVRNQGSLRRISPCTCKHCRRREKTFKDYIYRKRMSENNASETSSCPGGCLPRRQSASNTPRGPSLTRTENGNMQNNILNTNRGIESASDSFGNNIITRTVQGMRSQPQVSPTRDDQYCMPDNNSASNRNNALQIITPTITETTSTVPKLKKKDKRRRKRSSDKTNLQPTSKKVFKYNRECPICYENFSSKSIVSTLCGHIFCMDCIKAVAKSKRNRCPTCRSTLKGYHEIYL